MTKSATKRLYRRDYCVGRGDRRHDSVPRQCGKTFLVRASDDLVRVENNKRLATTAVQCTVHCCPRQLVDSRGLPQQRIEQIPWQEAESVNNATLRHYKCSKKHARAHTLKNRLSTTLLVAKPHARQFDANSGKKNPASIVRSVPTTHLRFHTRHHLRTASLYGETPQQTPLAGAASRSEEAGRPSRAARALVPPQRNACQTRPQA